MSDQTLSCGHPIQAISKMLPDFIGDTPATQRIGTVYCRWCNDVARAEARVKELETRLADLRRPTHGPCCTCQRCGKFYDDCRCDLDAVVDDLVKAEARMKGLEEALRELMMFCASGEAYERAERGLRGEEGGNE